MLGVSAAGGVRDVAGQLLDPLLQPGKLFYERVSLVPAAPWGIGSESTACDLVEAPSKVFQPRLYVGEFL